NGPARSYRNPWLAAFYCLMGVAVIVIGSIVRMIVFVFGAVGVGVLVFMVVVVIVAMIGFVMLMLVRYAALMRMFVLVFHVNS
ncbi:MAG: hypothetical protein M3126_04815, partial [Candidatus Eremiobacteraeota bacterium]|nr:hypothetical protein [Candidatus Eremiobacteraeota bacterium]